MLPPLYRDILFWLLVALCVVAQVGILRPLVAPRPAPAVRPGVPVARRATEVVWTVVPALGLALLLVLTWRALRAGDPAADRPVPAVSVLAVVAPAPGR